MTYHVHHICRCLNRTFNFGEWCAYIKAHPNSGHESVFEEFGFQWNIHDVCLNPHRINIIPRNSGAMLEVRTAKSKRGYGFGISHSGIEENTSSGGGYGVYYDSPIDEYFNTENGAIIAALKKVRKKTYLRKEYAALIDLEISLRQNTQLTLF